MAAMLKHCRHLEFVSGTRTFLKSKEYLSKSSALYHNLKESSTFGQLSAVLLLIVFRIMASYIVSVEFPDT